MKEHPLFTREENDIRLNAPISFPTAVFGGEITIPTLDGEAKLKVPKGTQSHTVFRLRGKGIVDVHSRGHGDLFVQIVVETPKKLTRKQEKALKEFADFGGESEPHKGLFAKLKEHLKS